MRPPDPSFLTLSARLAGARPRTVAAWRRVAAFGLAAWMSVAGSVGLAWDRDRMMPAAQRIGPAAAAAVPALQQAIAMAAEMSEEARLGAINSFFNRRIVFTDDRSIWGVEDRWTSPLELLGKGAGDCEDFAIAKYFGLLAAGVPVHRLRLVYVRALIGGPGGVVQPHMVLAYYPRPDAEPTILDNLIDELRPASRRPDLTPVFSFNSEGLWQGSGGPSAGDPVARLSRWREVLAKARAEGFQ